MAGDVVLDQSATNPCCAELKKKYKKLEKGRNALRQAVDLLEHETTKLIAERDHFKKAYEDEQSGRQTKNDAQEQQSGIRHDLEKEIHDLRSELSSYKESACTRSVEELQIGISKGEMEIKRLKDLLEKEAKRADSEKKKADAENKKAEQAWNLLKMEKSSIEEQRSVCSRSLEELQIGISKGEMEIKKLKDLLEKEKKRADLEKKKADAESKRAAEAWKLLKVEKSRIEDQRKIAETERKNADDTKRISEIERNKAEEYRLRLERVQIETADIRDKSVADAIKKVEAQRQKASNEKKRADSERRKVEEQNRLVELERRKAIEQNACISRLSEQLDEEKRRREELEKMLKGTVPVHGACKNCLRFRGRKNKSDKDIDGADVKLLRQQLKLSKKQAKYAKKVAQLEKEKMSFIKHQLYLLKQDFIPFSCRLNLLDNHLSNCGEHTEAKEKIPEASELPNFNLHNGLLACKPYNFNSQSDFGLINTCYKDSQNSSGLAREGIGNQLSRGSCTRPISGTNSEWESPVGDPFRKKSQSSAICSTTTSLSHKEFMGSQGRDALVVSASTNLAKNHSNLSTTIPEVTGEFAEMGVVAEKADRKHLKRMLVSLDKGNEASERGSNRSRKKRKILDALETVKWLCSEDNDLGFKIRRELSSMRDIFSGEGRCCTKFCSQTIEKPKHLDAERSPLTKKTDDPFMSKTYPCKKAIDAVSNDSAALLCFENLVSGDYMKLLNLDSDLDERRYREAVEVPLSPTLPEIDLNCFQLCGDDARYLVEGPSRSETEARNAVAFHALDVVKPEIESNALKPQVSKDREQLVDMDRDLHSSKEAGANIASNKDFGSPRDNILNNSVKNASQVANGPDKAHGTIEGNVELHQSPSKVGSSFLHAGNAAQTRIHQDSDMVEETALEVPVASADTCPQEETDRFVLKKDSMCLVVFSNTNNEGSLSKIFLALNTAANKNCTDPWANFYTRSILHALAFESDLLPQEKVSVFFSLLLHFTSGMTSASSTFVTNEEFLACCKSIATEIIRVISDEKGMPLFQDSCQLNILVNLIQDFLVVGKVLVCDKSHTQSIDSHNEFQCLEGRCLLFKDATSSQLVAGSILLASICAELDHIPFLLETSYKIIRMCRRDTSWVLSVLHIFASVCGRKFFTQENYSSLLSAIGLVVSFLEEKQASVSKSTCFSGESDVGSSFSPCEECPFSASASSKDKFMSSLLNVLHDHAMVAIRHPTPQNTVMTLVPEIPESVATCEHSTDVRQEFGSLITDCGTSCPLSKYKKQAADCSDHVTEKNLCVFSDIISLVELVAYYQSWEWTCDKIMPRLASITQSCVDDNFTAALCLLLGQLARHGVEACGYQHKGIAEVRHHLHIILTKCLGGKRSLPVQFAAVHSLLNLLPVSFTEIIDLHLEIMTEDAEQSDHIKLMRKWFSLLNKEHQSLSLNLFMSGQVP
ncbi:Actin filament-coating protein tropomyosin protein [Dioscorea alata]|uniref:Actin filament-coating protein tropomyosin protein n=1 Tax=Dioscorea alata TaxID=55571 RepID=A0ACB7VWH3_DIOAL|nr:Actin filament-coating protein tropomyosin protein [Dioscorea alata]